MFYLILATPDGGFLGLNGQYKTAEAAREDGRSILDYVIPDGGFIVYDADGEWHESFAALTRKVIQMTKCEYCNKEASWTLDEGYRILILCEDHYRQVSNDTDEYDY